MMKFKFWLLLAFIATAGATCQGSVFGCSSCKEVASQTLQPFYSCTKCQPTLYLYRHFNSEANSYQNICVPDCPNADHETINDEIQKQCIYLGPHCNLKSFTTNSVTGKQVPYCKYSYLDDNGYTVGSKHQIMKYLLEGTSFDPATANFESVEDLRTMASKYMDPVEESYDLTAAETNVKIVAECKNKYCESCEDYDLSKCKSCKGRFGNQNKHG